MGEEEEGEEEERGREVLGVSLARLLALSSPSQRTDVTRSARASGERETARRQITTLAATLTTASAAAAVALRRDGRTERGSSVLIKLINSSIPNEEEEGEEEKEGRQAQAGRVGNF